MKLSGSRHFHHNVLLARSLLPPVTRSKKANLPDPMHLGPVAESFLRDSVHASAATFKSITKSFRKSSVYPLKLNARLS